MMLGPAYTLTPLSLTRHAARKTILSTRGDGDRRRDHPTSEASRPHPSCSALQQCKLEPTIVRRRAGSILIHLIRIKGGTGLREDHYGHRGERQSGGR